MSPPRLSCFSSRPCAPVAVQGTSSSTGQCMNYSWPYLLQPTWQGTKRQRCAKEAYQSLLQIGGEGKRGGKVSRGGRVKGALPYWSNAAELCSWLQAEWGQTVLAYVCWDGARRGKEVGWMVVVGTEGWAGKTSVILSSMLSHHRTNGLWGFFYSPKARKGKRYQLACDHCSFVPFSISVGHWASSHQKVRIKGLENGHKVREQMQICQIKINTHN